MREHLCETHDRHLSRMQLESSPHVPSKLSPSGMRWWSHRRSPPPHYRARRERGTRAPPHLARCARTWLRQRPHFFWCSWLGATSAQPVLTSPSSSTPAGVQFSERCGLLESGIGHLRRAVWVFVRAGENPAQALRSLTKAAARCALFSHVKKGVPERVPEPGAIARARCSTCVLRPYFAVAS